MIGRTVFVIAHRLSTVRNSNAIMVLEHGEIIERGDHNALMALKGRYYELCTGKAKLLQDRAILFKGDEQLALLGAEQHVLQHFQ